MYNALGRNCGLLWLWCIHWLRLWLRSVVWQRYSLWHWGWCGCGCGCGLWIWNDEIVHFVVILAVIDARLNLALAALADDVVPVNVELLACGASRGHVTDGLGKLGKLESHRAGQEQVSKYGCLLDAIGTSECQLGHGASVHLLTSVEVSALKSCDGKVVDARRE